MILVVCIRLFMLIQTTNFFFLLDNKLVLLYHISKSIIFFNRQMKILYEE